MEPRTPLRPSARPRRRRRRAVLGVVVVLVVALGAGLALTGCSGGDDDTAAPTSTTAAPKTTVDVTLGEVSADSAGAPVTISSDQSQRVLDALTTYVKGATVQPLRSGKPATADFGAIFDANTLASAMSTDRGILLDEGLPRVTGDLTVTTQPANLLGLGDQSGNLTLITTSLAVDAVGATSVKGAAPVHVLRTADFTLQPDGSGAWKITAYNVTVARDGVDVTPTTSAASTTTGAAK